MKKKLLSGLLTLAVATTSLVSLAGCNKIFDDDSVRVDTDKNSALRRNLQRAAGRRMARSPW